MLDPDYYFGTPKKQARKSTGSRRSNSRTSANDVVDATVKLAAGAMILGVGFGMAGMALGAAQAAQG